MIDLRLGDCIEVLKTLEDNSVDSIVTDPPYGIGFMNKEWDNPQKHKELIEREAKRSEQRFEEGKSPAKGGFSKGVQPGLPIGGAKEGRWFQEWCEEWAAECFRVLKPGGHILSFSAPRTYHRMATAFEEVGFQVRDQIMWVFGSGFPKSHNIGKAIDKMQGNEREVLEPTGRYKYSFDNSLKGDIYGEYAHDIKLTKGQGEWEGWGTALKPAHEPICMARKPLSEKSIAENVLKWGTGGINIDGSRIGSEVRTTPIHSDDVKDDTTMFGLHKTIQHERVETTEGRFPANIMFDEEAGKILDEQSGDRKSTGSVRKKDTETDPSSMDFKHKEGENSNPYAGQSGGASRFFYCPKVSKKERGEGNVHPTVKPIALMEYLIKLVTPKGGIVLEPFMGSGSTGIAAKKLGMSFIGIEKEEEYMEIAKRRIENYEV